ncbi:MAG: hypothetical protein JWP20_1118 [Roseomonas sp.]|nr:hypothetical protein [Roseomonas sp.]
MVAPLPAMAEEVSLSMPAPAWPLPDWHDAAGRTGLAALGEQVAARLSLEAGPIGLLPDTATPGWLAAPLPAGDAYGRMLAILAGGAAPGTEDAIWFG